MENNKKTTMSVLTTSREKSHLVLAELFKSTFGDLSNFDKTTFNAWTIERLTDIQRDLAISLSLEKDEQFLNTCKTIAAARKIGYNYNFDSLSVKPAIGTIGFQVALPATFKNSKLLISADTTKMVSGDIQYLFPGDIEIVADINGNLQAIRRSNHIFKTEDNVILRSVSSFDSVNEQTIFMFSSEVIQLDYEDSFIIVDEHIEMTTATSELEFKDNFYKVELWYNYFNQDLNKNVKVNLTEVKDFLGYSSFDEIYKVELTDDNKVKIIFPDGINGKYYAAGKEIQYRLYTTKGSKGNIINPIMQVGTGIELNDVSTSAKFLLDPINGRNEFTLLELKDAIRKKIQTPNTIITDNDLKNNLSEILNLSSEETFHKLRRNDPIERILELFITVKQNNGVIVPTNTLDIEIDTGLISGENNTTIKPFFLIESSVFKDENDNDVRKNKLVPSFKTKNPNNMYFSSYYAIKLQKNPLLVNFYNLSANYNLSYENTYSNKEQVDEVYINSLILERNIFDSSNTYFFRMTLDSLNKNFLKNNTLIIKARFSNSDINTEDFIVDFIRATDENGNLLNNIYEAKITSLDTFSNNGNLFIKDVYKKEQVFTDGTENWTINTSNTGTEINDSLQCEICIFHNYETETVINNRSFRNIRGVRKLLLLSTYSLNNINLYHNIDQILYCQAVKDKKEKNIITIKNVPLYEDKYLNAYENRPHLSKQMEIEFLLKSKLNNKLEFPSRLSLKYFNTYGYSDLYSSLKNVSLVLEFEISFKNNKYISQSEENEIKNNLIKFINNINKKELTEDKNIYVSDLISVVTSNPNIIQCRLLNFNDNIFYQKRLIDDFNFVPASLQLDAKNIIFTVKSI